MSSVIFFSLSSADGARRYISYQMGSCELYQYHCQSKGSAYHIALCICRNQDLGSKDLTRSMSTVHWQGACGCEHQQKHLPKLALLVFDIHQQVRLAHKLCELFAETLLRE